MVAPALLKCVAGTLLSRETRRYVLRLQQCLGVSFKSLRLPLCPGVAFFSENGLLKYCRLGGPGRSMALGLISAE